MTPRPDPASLCPAVPHLPQGEEGPVFGAPWEARAFAMVVSLHRAGHFTWPEWVQVFSAELSASEHAAHAMAGDTDDYYTCWLAALEKMLALKGIADPAGVEAAVVETVRTWPHPAHIAMREPVGISPAA